MLYSKVSKVLLKKQKTDFLNKTYFEREYVKRKHFCSWKVWF
jgi:hypothetical protein